MKNTIDLTPKQKALLTYLEDQIRFHEVMPSLREIAFVNQVSHSAIAQMLRILEKKGYVQRGGKYSRSIRLVNAVEQRLDPPIRARNIPIIGTIAAGLPLYAQQEWDGAIAVDPLVFKRAHLFALRIKGDSMTGAGILDKDLVICEPRQFASNGDIVAALINHEEATVKRFFYRKTHIELKPENPNFKPVKYGHAEVLVQGKVIGLIREPGSFGS